MGVCASMPGDACQNVSEKHSHGIRISARGKRPQRIGFIAQTSKELSVSGLRCAFAFVDHPALRYRDRMIIFILFERAERKIGGNGYHRVVKACIFNKGFPAL